MNWKYYNPKFEYERTFEDSSWPWAGHRRFAYDLVANIKPKIIVELGTHYGTSFWSFAQAVKDENIGTELNAIDTWKGEEHSGYYGEEVFETVRNINDNYYSSSRINLIRKTFDEAVSAFEDNSIDILHIDGLHTYEAVKHDFENWLPKVHKNGVILLHDIKVAEDDFGVYRLWDELKNKYASVEFHHSYGLGVIFLDRRQGKIMKASEGEWQMHYSYIFEIERSLTIKHKDWDVESKDEEIRGRDHVIRRQEKEVDEKRKIIQFCDKDAMTRRRELESVSAELDQRKSELTEIKETSVWKTMARLRKIQNAVKKIRSVGHPVKRALTVLKKEGPVGFVNKIILHVKYRTSKVYRDAAKREKAILGKIAENNGTMLDTTLTVDRSFMTGLFNRSYEKSPFNVVYKAYPYDYPKDGIKLLAFYLPQYHPFPENERFWGKGFTEWTNVTRAVPIYKDHYQPRLPGELGFYDTRFKEVIQDQIRIAKNYGIHGFCFHHYWFSGKPVMRAPYNHIMANPDLDIPFCLNWANEPWTARWDGFEKGGTLLDQCHTPEDDEAFIRDIEPALKDKRYIRIEGKPMLVIYRPALFPDMKATIKLWNRYCKSHGIGKLYLVLVQTNFDGRVDPRDYGFDAAIEYPPHNTSAKDIKQNINLFVPEFAGSIHSYDEMTENSTKITKPKYTLFRGLVPDWDCTPRRNNPSIFYGSSPDKYEMWLANQIEYSKKNLPEDERFIFINAWNEWAEGAYLEPDRKWGFAYLDATRKARINSSFRIAVVAHLFYDDLSEEIIQYLKNIPIKFDLYVSTNKDAVKRLEELFSAQFGKDRVTVRAVPNVGFDIAPFLCEFKDKYSSYDLICKIHGKKSLHHKSDTCPWRTYLLDSLLGSPDTINDILSQFYGNKHLGIVFPDHFHGITHFIEWGSNKSNAKDLCGRLGVNFDDDFKLDFPSGSMFWFRPRALKPLLDHHFETSDFGEKLDRDGTLAHAVERLPCLISNSQGYSAQKVVFNK